MPRVTLYDTEEKDSKQRIAFQPTNPNTTELAPGRYWIREVHSYSYGADQPAAAFTFNEGTFRLLPDTLGKALYLEQQRAGKQWQLVLTVPVAQFADSLAKQHASQRDSFLTAASHSEPIKVPSLVLQAQTPAVQLQVVFEHLNREQAKGRPTKYYFRSSAFLTFGLPK